MAIVGLRWRYSVEQLIYGSGIIDERRAIVVLFADRFVRISFLFKPPLPCESLMPTLVLGLLLLPVFLLRHNVPLRNGQLPRHTTEGTCTARSASSRVATPGRHPNDINSRPWFRRLDHGQHAGLHRFGEHRPHVDNRLKPAV